MLHKIGAGAVVGRRHGDVGQNVALERAARGQTLQCLHEYVDTLVAVLVAAAGADNQRLLLEFAAQTRLCNRDHRLTRLLALLVEDVAAPYEVVLEAVGRDVRNLTSQKILALVGRDLAHGQEGVVVERRHLLDRVLGRHVETARYVVGVIFVQVGIERQPVAGDAAARNRGVRGEERSHIGRGLAQVESARSGHPLVEVSRNTVYRGAEVVNV